MRYLYSFFLTSHKHSSMLELTHQYLFPVCCEMKILHGVSSYLVDLWHNKYSTCFLTTCQNHCFNCKESKDFVDTNLCASESAAGISAPIFLILVSNPEIIFNDSDVMSNASGRDFKSQTPTKKSFTIFIFHISTP